jgi:hypothetical protein
LTVHPFLLGLLRCSAPGSLRKPAPEEWEEITREAAVHGLTPLLYRWLRRSGNGRRLPAAMVERLERQAVTVAARNLILADELARILRAFAERQLPCAPLRGLALAERLYGDLTARPMGDIDLLVRKVDLAEVGQLLRDQGFIEMDRRPGFAAAFSYTLEFCKDRHGWIIVEPHWTLAYPPFADRVDMGEVWARCARHQVVGVETWGVSREDLFLHLCLHVVHRDGTAPLLWYHELDRLLRQAPEAFDWSRFLSVARTAKLEPLLVPLLRTLKTLLATPVPDHVLELLDREPRRGFEARLHRLLAQGTPVDGKESLAALFTLKGARAKVSYVFALLFPSPEFMMDQYGVRWLQLGFAYLRRFCRLSWESLKGVTKLYVANLPGGTHASRQSR